MSKWFKRYKNMILISVIKNILDALQLWKKTNCGNIGRSCKMMEN